MKDQPKWCAVVNGYVSSRFEDCCHCGRCEKGRDNGTVDQNGNGVSGLRR